MLQISNQNTTNKLGVYRNLVYQATIISRQFLICMPPQSFRKGGGEKMAGKVQEKKRMLGNLEQPAPSFHTILSFHLFFCVILSNQMEN